VELTALPWPLGSVRVRARRCRTDQGQRGWHDLGRLVVAWWRWHWQPWMANTFHKLRGW